MGATSTPQGVSINILTALGSVFVLAALAYISYKTNLSKDRHLPDTQRYKLVYTVLPSHLAATKDAVFEAGAGTYAGGKYKQVAYEATGRGQFIPVAERGAIPHTGTPGTLEKTEEIRVEIMCIGRNMTTAAVEALKRTHPYEVCAYEVYKIEDF